MKKGTPHYNAFVLVNEYQKGIHSSDNNADALFLINEISILKELLIKRRLTDSPIEIIETEIELLTQDLFLSKKEKEVRKKVCTDILQLMS